MPWCIGMKSPSREKTIDTKMAITRPFKAHSLHDWFMVLVYHYILGIDIWETFNTLPT